MGVTSPGLAQSHANPLGASNAERRVAALAEARHLLTLVALPAGSTRLAEWNATDGPGLQAVSTPGDPDLVDVTRYHLVPHGASSLAWLQSTVPHGATISGSGSGSGPGVATTYSTTFSFRSTLSYLTPELEYSMVMTASGKLGLRVDAIVTWTPQKSRFSILAGSADRVVVTVDRSANVKVNRFTTLVVTKAATIRAFLARVNELPVALPGVMSCPLDLGATMTLSFSRAGQASPFAVVSIDPAGCGGVTITQFDANGRVLGVAGDAGGSGIARYVAMTLGVTNWTGMSALR